MANPVFRTAYEIVGDGVKVLEEFRAQTKAARDAHWETVRKYGADGYRPSHSGGIRSLLFAGKEAPEGWRQIGREQDRVECVPHKGRAIGKAALSELAEAPKSPQVEKLASLLGYQPASAPMDGYKIYWPTLYDFGPTGGPAFLHIPRQAGDGFEPNPDLLREHPESTLMLAMESHNAKVRAMQAEAA